MRRTSTRLLKEHVDVFSPFLTALFNRLLSLGVVPSGFKAAYITPRLKKSDLDPADAKSFLPISNLTVLSKLLERLVARQLLNRVRSQAVAGTLVCLSGSTLNRDACAQSPFGHIDRR